MYFGRRLCKHIVRLAKIEHSIVETHVPAFSYITVCRTRVRHISRQLSKGAKDRQSSYLLNAHKRNGINLQILPVVYFEAF